MGYIILSDGRYYCGDLTSDSMSEITRPTTLPGIVRAMTEKDFRDLRKKQLKPMDLMMDDRTQGVDGI